MPSKANYTLNTNVTSTDRSSKVWNKIQRSFKKMTGTVTRESKVAGNAFKRFSRTISRSTKRALVSINEFNAKINRFGRNVGKKLGFLGKLGLTVGISAALMFMGGAIVSLETNLASLSAITGITGDQFKGFEKEIDKVSKAEKIFAADTAKAFELVGSAKPELLSSAKALGEVATSAIILSKASGDELADNVSALTNVLNQFSLGANESTRAMNVLAAASVVGDTKIAQTSQAFKVAGIGAKMAGLNIEEMSGTIALFSKFTLKGAEAGTKFRNILSKMSLGRALPKEALTRLKAAGVNIDIISDKTIPYIDRLKELSKIQGNTAALTKLFNEENKDAAAILLNNLPLLEENIKNVTGTAAASDQAAIKTNTLAVRWQEMIAVFKNAITSTDSENKSLQLLKDAIEFVTDNMNIIIPVVGSLVAALVVFKIVMAAVNFVMLASPVTWIILGIVALIAAVVLMVVHWDAVKAALSRFWETIRNNPIAKFLLAPIFAVIDVIGFLISNFDTIKSSVMNFWDVIKDSPITKFLLLPIIAVIESTKLLISGIKSALEFVGLLDKDVDVKVSKSTQSTTSEKFSLGFFNKQSDLFNNIAKEDKLIIETEKNTTAITENTKASKKEWKGRFTTSILRDANIPSTAIKTAQREIAISGMAREFKNTSIQNSIINNNVQSGPTEVVTPFSGQGQNNQSNNKNASNKNSSGTQQIFISVVDKTGGKFGVEVESTGLEVNTTGN